MAMSLEENELEAKEHEDKMLLGLVSMDVVKKFGVPVAMVACGLVLGGIAAQGIYVGVLTTGGVWIMLDQMRESSPEYYNWLMDHAISADFVLSAIAAIGLGFSVTGLIGAAVVNILVGIALEWHREMYGKVKDKDGNEIPSASAIGFFKALFSCLFGFIKTAVGFGKKKEETVKSKPAMKQAEEALAKFQDGNKEITVLPSIIEQECSLAA